jgi:hypothetical protein
MSSNIAERFKVIAKRNPGLQPTSYVRMCEASFSGIFDPASQEVPVILGTTSATTDAELKAQLGMAERPG